MALTLRTIKGSRLTHEELDGNFRHFTGSHTVDGTVTATAFVGDGSALTGILHIPDLTNTTVISGSGQIAELNAGIISGSAQLPAGIVSGSAQLPAGIISGSAQLPAGTVSGSAQITITESQISDFGSYVTTTSGQALGNGTALALNTNSLVLTKADGTTDTVDLSAYLDEDARAIASGILNGTTGIVTFTRDDSTTFTLDLSDLLDDTNLVTSVNGAGGVVVLDTDDISEGSTNLYYTNARVLTAMNDNGVISGSAQVVAALPAGTVSGSAQVVAALPAGTISGSAQLDDTFLSKVGDGVISGSATEVHIGSRRIVSTATVNPNMFWGEIALTGRGVSVSTGLGNFTGGAGYIKSTAAALAPAGPVYLGSSSTTEITFNNAGNITFGENINDIHFTNQGSSNNGGIIHVGSQTKLHQNGHISASLFSGSFHGDGSNLTGITATTALQVVSQLPAVGVATTGSMVLFDDPTFAGLDMYVYTGDQNAASGNGWMQVSLS